jgi:hypothetical protein
MARNMITSFGLEAELHTHRVHIKIFLFFQIDHRYFNGNMTHCGWHDFIPFSVFYFLFSPNH